VYCVKRRSKLAVSVVMKKSRTSSLQDGSNISKRKSESPSKLYSGNPSSESEKCLALVSAEMLE